MFLVEWVIIKLRYNYICDCLYIIMIVELHIVIFNSVLSNIIFINLGGYINCERNVELRCLGK